MNNDLTEPDFEPFVANGFIALTGPIMRQLAYGNRFRLQIMSHHLNYAGKFHGGMAMSLQKAVFDQIAFETVQRQSPESAVELVTMNCDFIGPADLGDSVESHATTTRVTRSIIFMTGQITNGNRQVLTSSAIYRITEALEKP